jgi:hypothetical protein
MKKTLTLSMLAATVVGGMLLTLPAEAQGCHREWRHNHCAANYNAGYNPYNYNAGFNPYGLNPYVYNTGYNPYVFNGYNASYNPYFNGYQPAPVWQGFRAY